VSQNGVKNKNADGLLLTSKQRVRVLLERKAERIEGRLIPSPSIFF